jgi:hypothetical protein
VLSRTNGWQRIGIALSVAWLIVSCVLVLKATLGHSTVSPLIDISSAHCQAGAPKPSSAQKTMPTSEFVYGCSENYLVPEVRSVRWPPVLMFVLGPLLAGWDFILALIETIKWVAAGFRNSHGRRNAP